MSARLRRTALAIAAGTCVLAAMPPARALLPPREPTARPSGTPLPLPTGSVYPVGTPMLFVLDEPVSSGKTQPGTSVPIHLRDALVVNGVTVAPAGTTGSLTVVAAQRAHAPDVDGAVQIRIEPLILPSGKILPLRAIHEFLNHTLTAGQVSTRGMMDQTEDVFFPALSIYQAFRKGHELTIPRDSLIRVQTAAIIDAQNPSAVAIETPVSVPLSGDVPHSDFTPIALSTPYAIHPNARFTVKPRPTQTPYPTASPTSSGAPQIGASATAAASAASSPTPAR